MFVAGGGGGGGGGLGGGEVGVGASTGRCVSASSGHAMSKAIYGWVEDKAEKREHRTAIVVKNTPETRTCKAKYSVIFAKAQQTYHAIITPFV